MKECTLPTWLKYVGVDDKEIDLFEGQYNVPQGISYNSYVLSDEKVVVFDTVDRNKGDEWFARLDAALEGREPDYLVVSHLEPDHSANIATFAEKYPQTVLVGTAKAFAMMTGFFGSDYAERRLVVKEGDELAVGSHTLRFFTAPMVHWPEVMVTYEVSEGVLFSADAFGTFGASDSWTDDWGAEARRYYINICGKYGGPVQALLNKVAGLDVRMICPLHGPVLCENLGYYVEKYLTWSGYKPEEEGVLVAYASIYGNTAAAAERMAELLRESGVECVEVRDLARCDMSEAVGQAFRFGRAVLAAASYDAGVFTPMHDFLQHLKVKTWRRRKVALMENGSWAPSAAKAMATVLGEMQEMTICEQKVSIKSVMTAENVEQMKALAAELMA
ncbi:MAG: FprA family A-type flavoprotein [Tidjanibacter sp.]|nr:FprA family A-type flavoprotein [Tidjanibacter sp.]